MPRESDVMDPASSPRRYFDNAATTFPKPPGVSDAVREYMERIGASAGRGAYREALESARLLEECREALRQFFGCAPEDVVAFTLNGTDALNMAIKGVVQPGDHVVVTALEHNSVLRPLGALRDAGGVTYTIVQVDPTTTRLDPGNLQAEIRENTSLVVVNHVSNVTGVLQPLAEIAEICREAEIPLLVDGAQSAGHLPIDFAALGLDMLACPGHKGLLGPLGTGMLVMRAEVAEWLRTYREGGTGSESESPYQPESFPDKFESGSHNASGLAGLLVALRWLQEQGLSRIREHEQTLCWRMMGKLDRVPGLRWFGPRRAEERIGVFSIRLDGVEPAELSDLLETRFGILSRSGLHCAPLAHETLGTLETGGTTRLSLGPFLQEADIDAVGEALTSIARGAAQRA